MSDPNIKMSPPSRKDSRFDFVNKLPANVPPVQVPASSMFPFLPPVGPADATYYFPIQYECCNPTGVFFPKGYHYPGKINVIVYFHGHKASEFLTIDQYWQGGLHNIRLRDDINESGRKVVLIAPTMGPAPGSSLNKDMGIFRNSGTGDSFLKEVARWIGKYVPQYKGVTPDIGNIVLAGHSGAGGILLQQARTMKSHVCEVWGFDSMYGTGMRFTGKDQKRKPVYEEGVVVDWGDTAQGNDGDDKFDIEWLGGYFPVPKMRPATHFYFYWAGSSPGRNSNSLQDKVNKLGLRNVTVEPSVRTGGKTPAERWTIHFETLTANFKKRVVAAKCF